MKILNQNQLDEASEFLKKGEVIAFPTETVYGLGVILDDEEAYKKLVTVKRRPPEKPFTLMLADPEQIREFAKLNSIAEKLISRFMPGQFTIIVDAKPGLPKWCVSEAGKIGIRIADYDLIRNLIRKTGKALLVPSANKSGETPGTTSDEVIEAFNNELAAVIEGKSVSNTPSTIVLVEDDCARIIREGVVTKEDIEKVISEDKIK